MVLFDSLIKDVNASLHAQKTRALEITTELLCDAGKNNMVFSNEMAYELGGDKHKSLSFDLPTSNLSLINRDEIILIGEDLNEISSDTDFIRIVLLRVKEENLTGNDLYNRLEKIKFTKYRVSPTGYMLRTSTHLKEKVRISKDCAKESFSKIGSAYIKAYKQIPSVENVKIIFVTRENGLFESFEAIAKRKENIVDTIDHILKGMALNDCNTCSVKELCDEVEGLRQMHKEATK